MTVYEKIIIVYEQTVNRITTQDGKQPPSRVTTDDITAVTAVALLREEEYVSGCGRRRLPGWSRGGRKRRQLPRAVGRGVAATGRRRHGALPRVEEGSSGRWVLDERGGGGIAEGNDGEEILLGI